MNSSSDQHRVAALASDQARREFIEQFLERYPDVTKTDANEALEEATRKVVPSGSISELEQEMLVLLGFGREPGELPRGANESSE